MLLAVLVENVLHVLIIVDRRENEGVLLQLIENKRIRSFLQQSLHAIRSAELNCLVKRRLIALTHSLSLTMLRGFTSVSFMSRNPLTTSAWPFEAAKCKGVRPCWE